jgi:hypothetical protein
LPFNSNLPEWNNTGVEPIQTKKDEGWKVTEKPPAPYFNWFFNRTFQSLQDIINNAIHKEEKGIANGVATLGADGKVPASQLNVDTSKLATKTELNEHSMDETAHGIGDKTTLLTTNKISIVSAVNELFTNVSNGKDLVGTAITDVDDSVVVPADPTFQNLADLIRGIETGKKRANGTITADSNGHLIVNNLGFTPKMVSIYRGTSDLIVLTRIFDADGLNQGELWSGGLNFSYDYYNSLPSNPIRAFTFYPGGFHVTDVNDVGVWNYIAYEE